jgi:hypothetical protein
MQVLDVEPYVYGQPQTTDDGCTVITVSKVRNRGGSISARPMGVFVIKDGQPSWKAATDDTLIALIGVLTGLVAAAFATAAMIKRPPWPDIKITEHHSVSAHRVG